MLDERSMFVQGEATQKLAGRVDRHVIKLSVKCRPLIPQEFPKNPFHEWLDLGVASCIFRRNTSVARLRCYKSGILHG